MNSSIKVLKMQYKDHKMPQSGVFWCCKELFKHYWWRGVVKKKIKQRKKPNQYQKTACLQCLIISGSWSQRRFSDMSLHSQALMLFFIFFLPVLVEFPTVSTVSGWAVENGLGKLVTLCWNNSFAKEGHTDTYKDTLQSWLCLYILSLFSL